MLDPLSLYYARVINNVSEIILISYEVSKNHDSSSLQISQSGMASKTRTAPP